jgi:hypothetical protein
MVGMWLLALWLNNELSTPIKRFPMCVTDIPYRYPNERFLFKKFTTRHCRQFTNYEHASLFTDFLRPLTDTFETLETFYSKIVSNIKNVLTFEPDFRKEQWKNQN